MELELRKFTKFVDKTFIEGGKKAKEPVLLIKFLLEIFFFIFYLPKKWLFKKIETYLKYNVNAPMFMTLLLENLIFFYLKINYLGEKMIF